MVARIFRARASRCRISLGYSETPNLAAWFERVKTRPSYQDALMSWQPQEVAQAFAEYTKQRQKSGTDVSAYAH